MANTFTKIASVSVGVLGSSTISFTSIPSTYTDLVVKLSVRGSNVSNSSQVFTTVNGSAGSSIVLRGSGSAASSFTDATGMETARGSAALSTASTFSNIELYFPNYTSTTAHSISSDGVTENNATEAYAELAAALSTSTAAITSLSFSFNGSGDFVQYSTATLYGIKNS